MSVLGFDKSNLQGPKSVEQFREAFNAGHRFMIHKVSEGDDFVDSCYATCKANAQEAGLLVGGYHFARFRELDQADGFREAWNFLQHVGEMHGMLPPSLDDEWGSGDQTTPAKAWLDLVNFISGVTQDFLYSYGSFFASHLQAAKFQMYLEWLAAYQTSSPNPPSGWDRPDIWQFSSTTAVPGIGDNIDVNQFAGSIEDLNALVYRPQSVPSGPNFDTAAVSEVAFPDGSGGWRLHADGGVFTWGTAPFYGSYPGLPQEQRLGDRSFVRIEPRGDGKAGYALISNHNERYVFPA